MLSVSDCKIIARSNHSLSSESGLKLIVVLAIVTFSVALGFTYAGAWLVLPFAGLELLAFACAFYYVHLHASDFESIAIEHDRIIVEKRNLKKTSVTEFQRCWTQVSVRNADGAGASRKSGLFIGSHGREVEFGKHFISDDQRIVLSRKLKQKIKSIN